MAKWPARPCWQAIFDWMYGQQRGPKSLLPVAVDTECFQFPHFCISRCLSKEAAPATAAEMGEFARSSLRLAPFLSCSQKSSSFVSGASSSGGASAYRAHAASAKVRSRCFIYSATLLLTLPLSLGSGYVNGDSHLHSGPNSTSSL